MQGKLWTIGILGFGVDGQSVAVWLGGLDDVKKIVVFEENDVRREISDVRHQTSDMRHGVEGGEREIVVGLNLDGIDLLFRSPGFPLSHRLIKEAKDRGISVTSSTIEVLRHFSGTIVGITGSNGKTTCTAIIEACLRKEYGDDRVERGGNDGVPRLDLLGVEGVGEMMTERREISDVRRQISDVRYEKKERNRSEVSNLKSQIFPILVLELSSFQLIDSPVSPDVAVVLNVTPNHLNWHKDMKEYAEAKRQIVAETRDVGCETSDMRHQKAGSRGQKEEQLKSQISSLRRGSGWQANLRSPQVSILNPDDPIVAQFAASTPKEVRWFDADIPFDQVHCRTHPHTIRAAVTAARVMGVSEEHILAVLREFPGVPHRLEFVAAIDGVSYWNDSSCTTPESAITACNAFDPGSMILLLGGRDKGMDFRKLFAVIEERRVRVVSYGEMAEMFEQMIPEALRIVNHDHMNFEGTVETARATAHPGDHIVLSPACASFDLFKDAKERGREFAKIVKDLSHEGREDDV